MRGRLFGCIAAFSFPDNGHNFIIDNRHRVNIFTRIYTHLKGFITFKQNIIDDRNFNILRRAMFRARLESMLNRTWYGDRPPGRLRLSVDPLRV